MLEPHVLGLIISWTLTSCGLLNKCAVFSGRSVWDQQPDFPKDNATGSLFPPSVALAFLLGSAQSSLGVTKVEQEVLFHATSLLQESTAIKPSISWDTQPLPQCQDSLKNKMELPDLCYKVQGKMWNGCNILGITTKPATWMDRNLAGKMNRSWEIALKLEESECSGG